VVASRKEVAAAANVSLRTVSNVVNGFPNVAPETRARVLRVVAELDYRPSEIARMLKRGRSGLVGLLLPELDTPYFAELTRAFVEIGTQHGYTIVVDQTDGDPQRELEIIGQTYKASLFDGLIVSPLGLRSGDLASVMPDRPVVFLGEDEHEGFDQVRIDNFAAAREAVTHLLDSGRSRVAAIGAEAGPLASSSIRLAGYQAALQSRGLEYEPTLVAVVNAFRRSDGAQAMAKLLALSSPPDAVFCFSDPLALGATRTIHENGLRIPDDIAVVGFDDVEDGRFSTPTLSTVSPDKSFIAGKALELLTRRLNGESQSPKLYVAPHRLVVRESSATVEG